MTGTSYLICSHHTPKYFFFTIDTHRHISSNVFSDTIGQPIISLLPPFAITPLPCTDTSLSHSLDLGHDAGQGVKTIIDTSQGINLTLVSTQPSLISRHHLAAAERTMKEFPSRFRKSSNAVKPSNGFFQV